MDDSDNISRRDALKTLGAVTTGLSIPIAAPIPYPPSPIPSDGEIVDLYTTSEVHTPARGPGNRMRFSFDFPEPGVAFGDHRFSFLIFTEENTYSLDRTSMKASGNGTDLRLTC